MATVSTFYKKDFHSDSDCFWSPFSVRTTGRYRVYRSFIDLFCTVHSDFWVLNRKLLHGKPLEIWLNHQRRFIRESSMEVDLKFTSFGFGNVRIGWIIIRWNSVRPLFQFDFFLLYILTSDNMYESMSMCGFLCSAFILQSLPAKINIFFAGSLCIIIRNSFDIHRSTIPHIYTHTQNTGFRVILPFQSYFFARTTVHINYILFTFALFLCPLLLVKLHIK